ncbi:MAG: hypothetical protein QNK36_21565 [Colwellia sp.]|nr:hypothetical protein [Colwellia sp.]
MSTSKFNFHTDYLRIGLYVDIPQDQQLIIERLDKIAQNLVKNDFGTKNQILHPKYGYNAFLRLPLFSAFSYEGSNEETPHLTVKCDYRYGGRRFILIECKGHPYEDRHCYCLKLWLQQIFGRELLKKYWSEMLITNIHLAFGFNKDINDLLFKKNMARKSAIYFDSHGGFETIYFQPKNRMKETCIYDRNVKMKKRKLPVKPQSDYRAEIRLGRMSMAFEEFFEKPDSLIKTFNRIKAYDLIKLEKAQVLSHDALLAIKVMGVTAYLRAQPTKYQREVVNKTIKPFLHKLIDMDLIRGLYYEEVDRIKLINPLIKCKDKLYKEVKHIFKTLYLS